MSTKGKKTNEERTGMEPNTFQTPNLYVDRLLPLIDGDETKVLLYAVRRILGFQKRQDQISMTQFDGGTIGHDGTQLDGGTGLGHRQNWQAIKNLVQHGVLIVVKKGTKHTADKPGESTVYALQLDGSRIDWAGLEARQEERRAKGAARAANTRKKKETTPGPSDGPGNDSNGGITSSYQEPETSSYQEPETSSYQELNNTQGNQEKPSVLDAAQPDTPNSSAGEGEGDKIPLKKGKKRESQADPRTAHPAIQAIKRVSGNLPPKAIYNAIITRLGDEPDVERMLAAFTAWRMKDYRATNYDGWLDWYENGIPEKNGNGRTNGQGNGQVQYITSTDEQGRQVRIPVASQW